jgi:hypothetical protein
VRYGGETLDVHAPHHPIGGWKDFLIHLVTITVGLLIAVGIEGCVELHREHKLVGEARETMREEIQHNKDTMTGVLVSVKKERATMEKNIQFLTKVQENPEDKALQKDASITADYSMVGLRDTAWKTAQTTGALAFMPYTEAQRYSDVYGSQKEFLGQQEKIMEDEAQFFGVLAKTNFGHGDHITREQASLTLERFGVWNAHLLYLDLMAQATEANDRSFLEGKAAPTSFHEDMHSK